MNPPLHARCRLCNTEIILPMPDGLEQEDVDRLARMVVCSQCRPPRRKAPEPELPLGKDAAAGPDA